MAEIFYDSLRSDLTQKKLISGFKRLELASDESIWGYSATSLYPVWKLYPDNRIWIYPQLLGVGTVRYIQRLLSRWDTRRGSYRDWWHLHRLGDRLLLRPTNQGSITLERTGEIVKDVYILLGENTLIDPTGSLHSPAEIIGANEYVGWEERKRFIGTRESVTIGKWTFKTSRKFPSHRCEGKWASMRATATMTRSGKTICPRCETYLDPSLMETLKNFIIKG